MPNYRIEVRGLREFSRELKRVDPKVGKKLRKAHLQIANLVKTRTHTAMSTGGGGRGGVRRARRGVKAKATQKLAAIRTDQGPGWTLSVIWGQDARSGWYGRPRYADSDGRQFEPWVGNQYTPGAQNGKPYYLGDAVNESIDEAIDLFGDALTELATEAGF